MQINTLVILLALTIPFIIKAGILEDINITKDFRDNYYYNNSTLETEFEYIIEKFIKDSSRFCHEEDWHKLKHINDNIKDIKYLKDIYHYYNGRIALSEKRIGTARSEFEKSIKNTTEESQSLLGHVYFYLAHCFKMIDQKTRSRNALEFSLKYEFIPENKKEICLLTSLYLYFKEPNNAINVMLGYPKEYIYSEPELSTTLGRCYMELDLYNSAHTAFKKSIELDPKNYNTHTLKANVARILGKTEIALNDIKIANKLNPQNPHQKYILALINFELCELENTNNELKSIYENYKADRTYCLLYSHIALIMGEIDKAKVLLDTYFDIPNKESSVSENALLMYILINNHPPELFGEISNRDPYLSFNKFLNGEIDYTEVLKRIETANIAFFMALKNNSKRNEFNYKKLLEETIARSDSSKPEYICALWLLKKLE